jgi:hypothetical protein
MNGVRAEQYDQQIIGANHPDNPGGWLVSIDRITRVQMGLDYVYRRVTELKADYPDCDVTVYAERRVNPGGAWGRDDWWGTCDITIVACDVNSGDVLFVEIADYKDGRGYVSEKNNTQLQSYLIGALRPSCATGVDSTQPFDYSKLKGCRMTIIQPKTNPVIRYQEPLLVDLNPIGVKLIHAAMATDKEDAPLVPGKHCQWCKANPKRGGHCAAESQQSLQVVESMSDQSLILSGREGWFEYIKQVLADPKSLTPDQLSQLADAEPGMQSIFDKVREEIQCRIEQGLAVPGYAMVPGRASRVWSEPEDVIAKKLKSRRLSKDDIYPAKLASPAQIMKSDKLNDEQKKRIEKDLITDKAGKLTLKRVSHDHQAEKLVAQSSTDDLQSKAEMMFGDVTEESVPQPVSFL